MFDHAPKAPPSARRPAPAQKPAGRAPGAPAGPGLAARPAFRYIPPLAVHTPRGRPEEPRPAAAAAEPNRTGLPDKLKAGVEALSGLSMDDVRVHRNSSEPAKLGALAYAQGSDIHLGPGQERHLPHEAWHVVQQKQGRVRATARAGGAAINDESGFEREADGMARLALVSGAISPAPGSRASAFPASIERPLQRAAIVQLKAAPALREMMLDHFRIQARVPENFQRRLDIVAAVQNLAQHAQACRQHRDGADALWAHWRVAYDTAEADQQPQYPQGRNLDQDKNTMEGHFLAFNTAYPHLVHGGLAAAKRALALQNYFTGEQAAREAVGVDPPENESLNALTNRLHVVARRVLLPGAAGWHAAAGYVFNFNGVSVTNLGQLGGVAHHWTIHRDLLHGLDVLSVRANNIAVVMIPNGNNWLGVHVTVEHIQPYPRAYGRPASRHLNINNLPLGVVQADLYQALDDQNGRVAATLTQFANVQNASIRNSFNP